MSSKALLDKNAYLSIYVSQDTISANLAYSHYAIGRHYVLHDKTFFYRQRDDIEDQRFWDEYFGALEKKFNWEIVSTTKTDISMAQIRSFSDEGDGVAGITFTFQGTLKNRVKIQSVLHTYLPTASIKIVDENYLEGVISGLANKSEYTDIIYLNTDVEKFDIYRFRNAHNIAKEKVKNRDKYSKVSTKLHWDSKTALINSIKDKRFTAFSSIDTSSPVALNVWANYIYRPVEVSENHDLHDMLRSYMTVQLAAMNHNSPGISKKFGLGDSTSLLIVGGRLARLLTQRELIISLMDGLQLFGNFDVYVDGQDRLVTFGEMYAEGINSVDFIVPNYTLLEKLDKVFTVDVEGKRDKRHAIFSGELIAGGASEQIYCVSPSVDKFDLPIPDKGATVLTGRMQKRAYIEGEDKEITVTSSEETSIYRSVFFDSRLRPVVYGPDPSSNRNKLKSWLGE